METAQQFGGLVGRVVIHDNHVELEVGLLREGAVHGIADGLLTVVHGDHYRCLYLKLLFVEVGSAVVRWVDFCTDAGQMGGRCMLHLDLHLPVAWVHIVKLLDARGARVGLFFRIKFLVDVEHAAVAA